MGIIGQKWNQRIMPERLGVGTTETGKIVLIHWTKEIRKNGEIVYVGKTR